MFVSNSFSFILLAVEWQEEELLFIIYFQMIFLIMSHFEACLKQCGTILLREKSCN